VIASLSRINLHLAGERDLRRWHADTISISEEEHTCILTSRALDWLHPLAGTHACPHTLQEADATTSGITSVVLSHHRLDCLGCFIGMVERNRADVVVENVGLNNAVKEGSADETKLAIDGCSCTTSVVPCCWCVVR
jgi:hypothetical protein